VDAAAIEHGLKIGVIDFSHHPQRLVDGVDEIGVSRGQGLQTVENIP
jgi:hypothetical protein